VRRNVLGIVMERERPGAAFVTPPAWNMEIAARMPVSLVAPAHKPC